MENNGRQHEVPPSWLRAVELTLRIFSIVQT